MLYSYFGLRIALYDKFCDISMKILYGFERLYFLPILTTLNLFLIKKLANENLLFFFTYTFSQYFCFIN